MQADNAKKMLFSSDYPTDRVVWSYEATHNVPKTQDMANAYHFNVSHGLNFMPLVFGIYTVDDWATYQEIGTGTPPDQTPDYVATAESSSSEVLGSIVSFDSARTFKVRLVGLAPVGIDVQAITSPQQNSDDFIFNTSYDYMKLFGSGVESVTATDSVQNFVVLHSLGYIPSALVYIEVGGRMVRSGNENAVGVRGIFTSTRLTESSLIVQYDASSSTAIKIHYRIYLDE